MRTVRPVALCVLMTCAGQFELRALNVRLSTSDIERAVALARWPHTDAELRAFHERYVFTMDGPRVDQWVVEQVEVITEFRRIVLMSEEHGRINDHWGRGGIRDVQDSIRPFRGRVSIVARLGLRFDRPYAGSVPLADAVVGGPGAVPVVDVRRTNLYAGTCGADQGCGLTGGLAEFVVDAGAVGQAARPISVVWNGRELAHVIVNFAALE